jgi:clan AA aspartic protease
MALTGHINVRGDAVVPLRVLGEEAATEWVEAILDTGFEGHLLLPPDVIERLRLRSQGARPTMVGDGRVVNLRIYRARVDWDGYERDTQALMVHRSEPLIGMSLLWNHDVRLNITEGGSVTIEGLP